LFIISKILKLKEETYFTFLCYLLFRTEFDVRGSVHHSTIHKEKFDKM